MNNMPIRGQRTAKNKKNKKTPPVKKNKNYINK